MKLLSNILERINFRNPPPPPSDPDTVVDLDLDDRDAAKVAFEVPGMDTNSTIQVVFPCRTRVQRIEPECQVYVLIYRDFNRTMRYVEFHGQLRKEFGPKIPLWSADINGARDDDLMADAVIDGRAILDALRNPIVWDGIEDPLTDDPHPPASHGSARAVAGPLPEAPTPSLTVPQFQVKGRFNVAGYMPYRSDDGRIQKGRPSFGVLLRRASDDKEVRIWGSDLSRVLRDEDVQCGDLIELTKYPKTRVNVGNRVVQKNIWTCAVVQRSSNDHAAPGHQ
jgi:hypothetical protein